MKNLVENLRQIRAAILKDKLTSLVLHAGISTFIYLVLSFALKEPLTGNLIFILAVDSLMLSTTATVLFAFGGQALFRIIGLQSAGRLFEILLGAFCGGIALYLWAIPYPTVAIVAPSIAAAVSAGLAISLLINALGLLTGAVSFSSFGWKSLFPIRN